MRRPPSPRGTSLGRKAAGLRRPPGLFTGSLEALEGNNPALGAVLCASRSASPRRWRGDARELAQPPPWRPERVAMALPPSPAPLHPARLRSGCVAPWDAPWVAARRRRRRRALRGRLAWTRTATLGSGPGEKYHPDLRRGLECRFLVGAGSEALILNMRG